MTVQTWKSTLGALAAAVETRTQAWSQDGVAGRLRAKDTTLWPGDESVHSKIGKRLGWLESWKAVDLARLESFRDGIYSAGFRRVVLLGMGGSSLCPEVLRETYGVGDGGLDLRILDSTHPDSVRDLQQWSEEEKTLFVVASKSGGTSEVVAFEEYFRSLAGPESFVAITDPGTELFNRATERGYREIFVNDPDIGGRFSALSHFGLVPAALLGMDVARLVQSAQAMSDACATDDASVHPGLSLGAAIGEACANGCDKLTIGFSPEIATFGWWVEQLVAESTGKEGQGVLPVLDEPLASDRFGADRLFVAVELAGSSDSTLAARCQELEAAGKPVVRFELQDRYDLGGEFLRWEIATAAAGVVQGVNPFDEPNVTESKDLTKAQLQRFQDEGALSTFPWMVNEAPFDGWVDRGLQVSGDSTLSAVLQAHLDRVGPGDYLALLAYVPRNCGLESKVEAIRGLLAERTSAATTSGYGPRFLHSTGQLHKGGSDRGVFIQIVPASTEALAIPGSPFGFETLVEAQARGDLEALDRRGRRVLRIAFSGDAASALDRLHETIQNVPGA